MPQLAVVVEPQDVVAARHAGFEADIYKVISARSLNGLMRNRLRVIARMQLRYLG